MSSQINDIPEGFRMTELGLLPEEWGVIPFTESLGKRTGNVPDSIQRGEYKSTGKYPIVDQSEKYIAGYTNETEKIYSSDLPIIIFGDHTRIFKFVDFPFAIGADGTKILNPNPDLFDPRYFYYCLMSLDIPSRGYNRHFKVLKEKAVVKPPLPEQKAIARVLSTIQKAIEAQDKIIAATRELKKSLMKHLFTYGPVPVSGAEKVLLKDTEIGPVPEHWEVVRLEQVMRLRTENVLPEDMPDMRYVGLEHLDSGEIRLRRWGSTEQVRSAKSRFYPADILYGKLRPYLDKAALAEWEGVCSTDILVFNASNETVSPEYLAGLLHTGRFIEYAISTTSGVNHPRTSWSNIKSFLSPCPPVPEQQEIAHMLSAVDEKIYSAEKQKAALQALFKTMLNQLMTGKIRVKELEVMTA